ncbi:MAG: YhcN/YlaJ family sporulation lipoprotein [Tissierellia bacterium]|nr:YhcN/YlaJ family sporulation lipoprotein [Tissierellia bacterium]
MKVKSIFMYFLVCVLLIGCSTQNIIVKSGDNFVEDMSIPVGGADNEILERSETISDIVVELYGMDDATTIILNDTAIIGVKISYNQELTNKTIETIEQKVLDYDNQLTRVLVTNEEKNFTEISDVVYELLQGKSYDSQVNEINNIMNKIN